MVQDTQTTAVSKKPQESRFTSLLIGVGILWLLLAVALLAYQLLSPAVVEVSWETATEQGTAGFYVYRSQNHDEGFLRVNDGQLIESTGDSVSGARYKFTDKNVVKGRTYYYLLEEIELDGSGNQYLDEVIEYSVAKFNWWVMALAIISGTIGLSILINGLKEKRRLDGTNQGTKNRR